jgi:hypothetical protein
LWGCAAWFGAFAIGAATGKWFGVQAAAYIALVLGLAVYFWWIVYHKINLSEPDGLKPAVWAGVLFLVLLIPLSGWVDRAISTTGDEQIYLLLSQSFIQDGDFDTTNQAENKTYLDYYWGNWSKTFQNKSFRCFPLLLAPAMALGGRLGVMLFFSLAAAMTAWACCRMMLRLTRSPGAAWAASGLMAVSLAFTLPSLQIYPEVMAACAMSLCMLIIMDDKHKSIWSILAIALLVLFISSLKTRYFPAMSIMLAIALWRRNKWHLTACVAGGVGPGRGALPISARINQPYSLTLKIQIQNGQSGFLGTAAQRGRHIPGSGSGACILFTGPAPGLAWVHSSISP